MCQYWLDLLSSILTILLTSLNSDTLLCYNPYALPYTVHKSVIALVDMIKESSLSDTQTNNSLNIIVT